jgi:hypothetical protein
LDGGQQIFWSMERNHAPGDGTLAENWHTASGSVGFDAGKSERGTPGGPNSNGLPVAAAGPDLNGVTGETVNFDGSDSTDPEQQPLTFTWDFGDGANGLGPTPSHAYAAAGEYAAVLTVHDGTDGASDTVTVTIAPAPAAAPIPSNSSTMNAAPADSQPSPTACRGLIINELWPNPAGPDEAEFIELENPTPNTIAVTGCVMWLNEKRRYVFPSGVLGPRQLLVLEKRQSKLSLTNTGGSLRLAEGDGTTVDEVVYPKAPEDESWAKIGTSWGWTNRVTPGQANLEPTDEEPPGQAIREDAPAPIVTLAGLADVQTLESGEKVKIQGTVIAAADILASRTIWLQDDTAGLQAVLAEDASRPLVGDLIEAVGTVRSFQGRKRITVAAGAVMVLASNRLVEPRTLPLDQLSAEYVDQLVTVTGLVSQTTGGKIFVDDGSGEGEIYLKSSTGIVKPKMSVGDRLSVSGVVSATTSGLRILPRTAEDLRVERVLGAVAPVEQTTSLVSSSPKQTWHYWLLVAAGIMVAAMKPLWHWWQERKNFSE